MYQQRTVTNAINYNGLYNEKVPAARVNAQINGRSEECLWKALQKNGNEMKIGTGKVLS